MGDKMIKTLIVEDDIFDYSHLKNMISWAEHGFLLYDVVKNGNEAVEIIDNKEIDLVITDMSMPGKDGIEIIKYIRSYYPDIKVLAISGYDDFRYVKQSLKLGALDYILKHNLTPDSLLTTLKSIKEAVVKEENSNREKEMLARQLKTGRHTLVENAINKLVKEGVESEKQARKELISLGIKLYFEKIVVVAVQLDNYDFLKEKYLDSELSDLKKSFSSMANEILKDMALAVLSFLEDGKFVILFSFKNKSSEQGIFNQVTTTVNRLRTTIKQNFNLTACFAIADICHHINRINQYYTRAEQLLKKKFYYGKDKIFYYTSANKVKSNVNFLGIKEEKELLDSIKRMDKKEMISLIRDIFDQIMESQPSINSVKLTIISFINIVNKVAKEYSIELSRFYKYGDNPYEQLYKYDTFQELKEWIINIYTDFLDYLQGKYNAQNYSGITGEAMSYVDQHYKDDINLSIVADRIGVNSSYLSRKFKKDSGQGFIQYLNYVRIREAKSLIASTNCQIKEIVPEVGFNNYNYFFKVFKGIQGMTPVEYEESIRDSKN
ncbi:response regulator [Iocasia frigidifontis]|uniref:Stage 0 sporulation protein A homolog n=2 Tax=Iocasia fonsfrigidae TaxID=2682810 RepID=A0A8A7KHZ3_9FIRM|nr:response regulator [Iocasia fonsfrigidae]